MTAHPVPDKGSVHVARTSAAASLARWAVGLAAIATTVVTVSYAIFGVAYAVGGAPATEDNWVGLLGGVALVGGLAVSLVAFALAVAARVKHERWAPLWLPLSVFPALLALVMFAELFWWE